MPVVLGMIDSLRFVDWLVEGNDKLIFFYFLISVWKFLFFLNDQRILKLSTVYLEELNLL